jgi:hypothetical protein
MASSEGKIDKKSKKNVFYSRHDEIFRAIIYLQTNFSREKHKKSDKNLKA